MTAFVGIDSLLGTGLCVFNLLVYCCACIAFHLHIALCFRQIGHLLYTEKEKAKNLEPFKPWQAYRSEISRYLCSTSLKLKSLWQHGVHMNACSDTYLV